LEPTPILESPALFSQQPQITDDNFPGAVKCKDYVPQESSEFLSTEKESEEGKNFYNILKKEHALREVILRIDQDEDSFGSVDDDGFRRPREIKLNEKPNSCNQQQILIAPQNKIPEQEDLRVTIPIFSPLLKMVESSIIPESLQQSTMGSPLQESLAVEEKQQTISMQTTFSPNNFNLGTTLSKKQNETKIGTLTIKQRKELLARYLEKKKRRKWKKNISYDCRKKVAENRLRYKGRFVTKEQAEVLIRETKNDLTHSKYNGKVQFILKKITDPLTEEAKCNRESNPLKKVELELANTDHFLSNEPT
jgi:hypothetical protein